MKRVNYHLLTKSVIECYFDSSKQEDKIKEEVEFRTRMRMYMEETKNLGYYNNKDYEQDDWLEEEINIFEMKRNMPLSELIGEVDVNGEYANSDVSDSEY